ncbi:hypothetical protein SS50377_20644 [Spironucleus salmonicida]|nr:hypothetical protein SS50377_20644 [Spironucleus salmonicida]|eukprot:EST48109.1 Hypothetical protein SS50377_11748 [Spironucleus salmonicida]
MPRAGLPQRACAALASGGAPEQNSAERHPEASFQDRKGACGKWPITAASCLGVLHCGTAPAQYGIWKSAAGPTSLVGPVCRPQQTQLRDYLVNICCPAGLGGLQVHRPVQVTGGG